MHDAMTQRCNKKIRFENFIAFFTTYSVSAQLVIRVKSEKKENIRTKTFLLRIHTRRQVIYNFILHLRSFVLIFNYFIPCLILLPPMPLVLSSTCPLHSFLPLVSSQ